MEVPAVGRIAGSQKPGPGEGAAGIFPVSRDIAQ